MEKTRILKANLHSAKLAADLIKRGEVVALPTETVYGLAGDSTNPKAIEKIFAAKGRPADNPLIAHISNYEMFKKIAKLISEDTKKLTEAFWPGPLTVVVPKSDYLCGESCAGLDSVGVRMPKNAFAREVIELSGVPFSAPSANLSGKPSPTNAHDVFEDMNGKIPLIIDGGECEAGVESTVISMLEETPVLLRPGVITKTQIEGVLKKTISVANGVLTPIKDSSLVRSPGLKYRHYAPNAEVFIVVGKLADFAEFVNSRANAGTFALCFDGEEKLLNCQSLSYGDKSSATSQAHNLFTALRRLDKLGAKTVYARCPEKTGVALAVYNRLIRSAGFKVIDLNNKN